MVALITMLEGLPSLTARSIRKHIGSPAAQEGIGWFTGKNLGNLFDDEKSSNLLQIELKNIQLKYETITLKTPIKTIEGTQWENMYPRLFRAEMDIYSKFQLLQTVLEHGESKDRRYIEVKRLQKGILDSNNGVLHNLSVIHQELVGQTVFYPRKSLLEMWYNSACHNMIANPMSAKTCYDTVIRHLDKAAIIQFMGFLLFKGANDNPQFCSALFESFENKLKFQSDLMDTTISKHMKDLINPSRHNVFHLRPVLNVQFQPFVKRQGEHRSLIYEYKLEDTEEEKWMFEKSINFDEDGSLIVSGDVVGLHGNRCYISVNDKNTAISVSGRSNAQLFFVMPIERQNRTNIIIYKLKPESHPTRFLGNDLMFTKKEDTMEFTITKVDDTPKNELRWISFSDFKNRLFKIKDILIKKNSNTLTYVSAKFNHILKTLM